MDQVMLGTPATPIDKSLLEKIIGQFRYLSIDLVRDAIGNELLPCPLDVFFIESLEWKDQITAIKGALVYEA